MRYGFGSVNTARFPSSHAFAHASRITSAQIAVDAAGGHRNAAGSVGSGGVARFRPSLFDAGRCTGTGGPTVMKWANWWCPHTRTPTWTAWSK